MLLSELMRAHVIDARGEDLGSVDDVLLVQDGPPLAPFGAAFRVEGVVVGRGAVGMRLGYQRGGMQHPWLLRALFRSIGRRARYVPWEQVESREGERIRITAAAAELGPPPSLA